MIAVDGNRTMFTVDEVAAMIRDGRALLLAGCEPLLDQLPRGRWIAGTTPYFMSAEEGGIVDELLVTEGQLVEKGQPLMRLQPAGADNLSLLADAYHSVKAHNARKAN